MNPAEPQEERDSLDGILATLRHGASQDYMERTLRTLINEVKERDERTAKLAEALRRFEASEERASDLLEVLNDQATRIKQMEEALREAAETFQAEGLSTSAEMCRKALG